MCVSACVFVLLVFFYRHAQKWLPPSSYQPTDKNSKAWPLSACSLASFMTMKTQAPVKELLKTGSTDHVERRMYCFQASLPDSRPPPVCFSPPDNATHTRQYSTAQYLPPAPPQNWTVSESSQKGNDSEPSDKTVGWKNDASCLCVLTGYQLCVAQSQSYVNSIKANSC